MSITMSTEVVTKILGPVVSNNYNHGLKSFRNIKLHPGQPTENLDIYDSSRITLPGPSCGANEAQDATKYPTGRQFWLTISSLLHSSSHLWDWTDRLCGQQCPISQMVSTLLKMSAGSPAHSICAPAIWLCVWESLHTASRATNLST